MFTEGLRKAVDETEAVAFDVFDTLLVRPFLRPEHLFSFIEDLNGATGFAGLRVLAERTARRRCRPEVNLDEIYSFLPDFPDMKEKEVEAELQLCRPDPRISEIWNYAVSSGKKVLVVSDMYLPENVISDMLEHCGFSGWSTLYVSNKYSVGKCDGGLYDIILKDLGIGPSHILMIGDNQHSDGSVPESKGLRSYHWTPMRELYSERYPREYKTAFHEPRLSFLAGIDMLSMKDEKEDYWHMVGRRFAGPLVLALAMFVRSVEKNYDRLFFCSRDGYAVMKAYELLGGKKPFEYVYSSRYISNSLIEGVMADKKMRTSVPGFLKACGHDVPDDVKQVEDLLHSESEKYTEYLRSRAGDAKKILLIDSTTMNFSAQVDISKRLSGIDVAGCYCSVLKDSELPHYTFNDRSEQFISWSYVNLCELFLSSDEPHVRAVSNGKPVFAESSDLDRERLSHYPDLYAGEKEYILDFVEHFGPDCDAISSKTIDEWFKVLIKNEKKTKGPLWKMKWPSDVSNTYYVNLLFRPVELVNVAKCKIGGLLKI